MESIGVYEDLSLFNGDLVGISPQPDEHPGVVQDWLKGSLIEPHSETDVTMNEFQLQGKLGD